jgi:hypothetical protein
MKISTTILFCVLFVTAPLFARDKSDVLVMKNGDRLTCEIKALDAGVLYASFAYIQGTTSVDWSKVGRLESTQLFLVKTEDGSAYTGTLSTSDTGGARPVRIEVAESAEKNVVIEQQKIVTIDQTSDRFWQRFNGNINSGLIYSRGNESTQYTLGTQVQYPRERWTMGGAFDSTLSGSTGASTSTRNDGSLYARRTLRWNNWFYSGSGSLLQSSEQGISLQSNVGGGIGHYLKNTNHATIALIGGLAFQNTQYSQVEGRQRSQNTTAFMAGADLQLFKFKKTSVTASASAFPSITQPDVSTPT